MTFRFAALFGAFSLGASTLAAPVALMPAALAQESYQPLPLEEYGKLPDVERVAMSPSGDRIALLTTLDGKRVILAIEDQSKALTAIAVDDKKVRSIRWVGEDRIMMVTSQTEQLIGGSKQDKAEFSVAQILPVSPGAEAGYIFGNSDKYPTSIYGYYGMREIDGVYYGYFGGIEYTRGNTARRTGFAIDHFRPHLFKVNLETFDIEKVASAPAAGHSADYLIDENGEIAFSMDVRAETGDWIIYNADREQIVRGQLDLPRVGLVGMGYDGTTVIYQVDRDEEVEWYEIDTTGGEPRPFLEDIDIEGLFFHPQTGHLMGYITGKDENERYVFQDPALEAKAEMVRKTFAAFQTGMPGFTNDLSDVIVRTTGNGDSGTYYAVDLVGGKANAIAYERLSITPQHVGDISTFAWTASDGLEIDGVLTLPPGREHKDLPFVLLPHGGPHAADAPVFDWWAQAFASRGYAVLQPNFRGSTNKDRDFMRAGYGEWGRKMQTDKTEGMMALAEAGIIDPSRACIVGASYGGYAALAGVTVQQGMFKCAVAVAPVSDIRDMYNQEMINRGYSSVGRAALKLQFGDDSLWDSVSPVKLADRADAPILLIHGVDDTVVPYSHSTRMAGKLKDFGKTYELVTLDGEDHWLSLSETRQTMLSEAVEFVERYNPSRLGQVTVERSDSGAE